MGDRFRPEWVIALLRNPHWGRPALLAALARAVRFRRFKAKDVRDILAASESAPNPTAPGLRLELDLPEVPVRSLTEYALQALR